MVVRGPHGACSCGGDQAVCCDTPSSLSTIVCSAAPRARLLRIAFGSRSGSSLFYFAANLGCENVAANCANGWRARTAAAAYAGQSVKKLALSRQ